MDAIGGILITKKHLPMLLTASLSIDPRGKIGKLLTGRLKEPKAVRSFIPGFGRTLLYREHAEPERTQIKTNNPLERCLEKLQRRIKPFRKFVNAGSIDRIVYGIVAYVLDYADRHPLRDRKSINNYESTQSA